MCILRAERNNETHIHRASSHPIIFSTIIDTRSFPEYIERKIFLKSGKHPKMKERTYYGHRIVKKKIARCLRINKRQSLERTRACPRSSLSPPFELKHPAGVESPPQVQCSPSCFLFSSVLLLSVVRARISLSRYVCMYTYRYI